MGNNRYHTFLSHSSDDKPAVEDLARRLVQEGLQPWLDKWNLIPGQAWQPAIEEALAACDTCAVLIGPSGIGPWQNEEMRAAISRRVGQESDFRVIPVLLPGTRRPQRSDLPTFLVASTWVEFHQSLDEEEAFHRLVCGIRGIQPGPTPGEATIEGARPYRGLQTFQPEDAPFFFGREALTEWLLTELRGAPGRDAGSRFLAIVGPSGSGKSSLARAGLVPVLRQGGLEGSETWPIVICRPGSEPLESLAVALKADAAVGTAISSLRHFMSELREDSRTLHLTTRSAMHGDPDMRQILILVDQFEEVFTLCRDHFLRQALIDNLLYAARAAQGRTAVVLTMRADFYGACSIHDALAAALSDHQILVGPMTDEELRRAIERPAQLVGCEFEQGLIDVLVRDTGKQAGTLPLLQYALSELWERREGRRLTHAAYGAIGGMAGALERRADEEYGSLDETQKEICRRIFLRLTQPGEGTGDTKRRASLQELLPAAHDPANTRQVIQALADARLITTEGDEEEPGQASVEVAHEALIRGWSRLRRWIEADREALRVHRRLTEAAGEWERGGHDISYLYRGVRLAQAEEWSQVHPDSMNSLEAGFMQASVDLRDSELAEEKLHSMRLRRRALIALVASVVAILLATATSVMYYVARKDRVRAEAAREIANNESKKAERQAQIATVRRLVVESKAATRDRVAISLALEAYRRSTEYGLLIPDGEQVLRDSVGTAGIYILGGHTDEVWSVAFSPDNRWLVTGCNDGIARLWSLDSYYSMRENGYRGAFVDILLVTPYGDGLSKDPINLRGHQGGVWATVFTPDSRRLITGGQDGTARIWDLKAKDPSQTVIVLRGHDKAVKVMATSADGRHLATAGEDGTCRLWDLTAEDPSDASRVLPGHTGEVCSLRISPDSRWLATCSRDQGARLWDLASEDLSLAPVVLGGIGDTCMDLTFSPDSRRLITLGADGSPRLWDLTAADPSASVTVLPGGSESAKPILAISPDGRWLATGSDVRTMLWALVDKGQSHEAVIIDRHEHAIWDLAFTPDSHRLVTSDLFGSVRVWDLTAPHPQRTAVFLHGHKNYLNVLAVSPDSHWLVAGGPACATLWSLWAEDIVPLALRESPGKLSEMEWLRYFPDEDYRNTGDSFRSER